MYEYIPTQLTFILSNIKQHSLTTTAPVLVAVSKTHPAAAIQAAYQAGQRVFGENRPQEMCEKYKALTHLCPEIQWHLIGQLQRNKVKYIAPFVALIHTVDSDKLLAEINHQAHKHSRTIGCLLQINISHEAQKSGMEKEEALDILRQIHVYPHIHIQGLMGMASLTDDTSLIRAQFRSLAEMKRDFAAEFHPHPQIDMRDLSMGMSGDYAIALSEGATLVRIGSAIFQETI
jgi:pyridoxal phosphate enzyme (YggS family)